LLPKGIIFKSVDSIEVVYDLRVIEALHMAQKNISASLPERGCSLLFNLLSYVNLHMLNKLLKNPLIIKLSYEFIHPLRELFPFAF